MEFRKSSYSNATGGTCVEVGASRRRIVVRDTKQAHMGDGRTVLQLTREDFRRLTRTIKQDTL